MDDPCSTGSSAHNTEILSDHTVHSVTASILIVDIPSLLVLWSKFGFWSFKFLTKTSLILFSLASNPIWSFFEIKESKDLSVLRIIEPKTNYHKNYSLTVNHNFSVSSKDPTMSSALIYQIFSLVHDWSKRVTGLNIPQLKLGNIPMIFPNFGNCTCCEKYLKDNKHNSLHLSRKYVRIFDRQHYLFLKAHSFPLLENCSLLGTSNVHGQN